MTRTCGSKANLFTVSLLNQRPPRSIAPVILKLSEGYWIIMIIDIDIILYIDPIYSLSRQESNLR